MSDAEKPKCYWTSTQTPRALRDRHGIDCEAESCRGCVSCPDAHCLICGIEHVTQRTCPKCIGATRDDLGQIASLYGALLIHAVEGGNYGRLEAARPIPGGEAMVMLSPGSHHGFHEYESPGDHMPTELLLATWEDDWRSLAGNPTTERASVQTAVGYLEEHLAIEAQRHDAFDAFADEMRRHRAHLEDVLHDGERIETGAPCTGCNRPLERIYGAQARNDSWWCDRCKIALKPDEYVSNVAREGRRFAEWLTASDMSEEYRIPRGSVTAWATKGRVRKRRDFHLGRMVYNVADAVTRRDEDDDRDSTRDVS